MKELLCVGWWSLWEARPRRGCVGAAPLTPLWPGAGQDTGGTVTGSRAGAGAGEEDEGMSCVLCCPP